jgi:hypothetical protein
MPAADGDRPGAPPRPTNPSDGPPKCKQEFDYAGLPRMNRRRVAEILGPAVRAELAEFMAERAEQLARAA